MVQFVIDGGLETDLIFHHGVDLPEFAALPLVEDERGAYGYRNSRVGNGVAVPASDYSR